MVFHTGVDTSWWTVSADSPWTPGCCDMPAVWRHPNHQWSIGQTDQDMEYYIWAGEIKGWSRGWHVDEGLATPLLHISILSVSRYVPTCNWSYLAVKLLTRLCLISCLHPPFLIHLNFIHLHCLAPNSSVHSALRITSRLGLCVRHVAMVTSTISECTACNPSTVCEYGTLLCDAYVLPVQCIRTMDWIRSEGHTGVVRWIYLVGVLL